MENNAVLKLFDITIDDVQMIVVGTVFIYALYFAMRSALFKPLLRHVEEREGVTAGALHTAAQMRQKAQALRERYDEGMLQARLAANKERGELVSKAKVAANGVISEAENQAAKELQAGRQGIDAALQSAYQKAEGEAKVLADTLTAKVDSQLAVH